MLCEICQQKEAVLHIQEIIDNKKKTLHICQTCAVKKGLDNVNFQGVNIAEILYNLTTQKNFPLKAGELTATSLNKGEKIKLKVCHHCKWDSDKLQRTGQLGCEKCYYEFSDIIDKMISNIQKGNIHVGKRLGEQTSEKNMLMLEIIKMQQKLEDHVKKEEFEKAAVLKKKIDKLKNNLESIDNEK